MKELIERISLDGLRVFAVCARQMNFSAAARELSVTQAAVSRRIKLLEDTLGYTLFVRTGRRIELTARGKTLFATVQGMLDYLDTTLRDLDGQRTQSPVSIAASSSVSHLWLNRRLRAFGNAQPEIAVRLLTTDSLSELARRDHDLTILYSTGQHPDWTLTRLFGEELVPVAHPDYLRARGFEPGTPLTPENLRDLDLIDYTQANPHWVTLAIWAQRVFHAPLPLEPRLTVSTYALAVDAALAGVGVILGSRGLLADLLDQGRLVPVSTRVLKTGYGYYLGVPAQASLPPETLALAGFLASGNEAM